jgi:uncharacterized protein (DUF111 family)
LPGTPNILRALVFAAGAELPPGADPAAGPAGLTGLADAAGVDRPGPVPGGSGACPASETIAVIEFDLDDMTGEEIGTAAGALRGAEGVLDVTLDQRWGKKGRPVVSVRVLARLDAAEAVARRAFLETSTIGLRLRVERRMVLPRAEAQVGGVPVKVTVRPDGERTVKTESDAVAGQSLAQRRRVTARAEAPLTSDGDLPATERGR